MTLASDATDARDGTDGTDGTDATDMRLTFHFVVYSDSEYEITLIADGLDANPIHNTTFNTVNNILKSQSDSMPTLRSRMRSLVISFGKNVEKK